MSIKRSKLNIKTNFYITQKSSSVREVFDKSDLLISFAPSSPILFHYFDNKI